MKAFHVTMLVLALGSLTLAAETMPVDLGAPLALNDFEQLDLKGAGTGSAHVIEALDVVSSGGPASAKGAAVLKAGARPVSVLYKPLTISPGKDKKWTISLDFQKGQLKSGESLPALGFTTDSGGVLAGGPKSFPGFFLRVKSVGADQVRYDYALITSDTKFEISPVFTLPDTSTNWYRLSVAFEAPAGPGDGEVHFRAELLDLGSSGTDTGTLVSDYHGQIAGRDLLSASQLYAGFRVDSATAVTGFTRFSLVVKQ